MVEDWYKYVLEMCHQADGRPLGSVPVVPVWEPAQEWATFAHLRRQRTGETPSADTAVIEPVWHDKTGPPYVAAVRVKSGDVSVALTTDYFRPLARAASHQFIEKGLLKHGDLYTFVVTAYQNTETAAQKKNHGFTLEEAPVRLPIKQTRLDGFAQRSVSFGEANPDDIAVFVPQHVLDETAELTRRAGAKETGGILIGHLHRDVSVPDLFLEVTAQIPAEHTKAEAETLTFTPATWTAVQAAIQLRRAGEIYVGWWHSHPGKFWCDKECTPEKRRNCPLMANFFSTDDAALHHQVFPKAYSVALVATHADAGVQFAMFGWRRAMLEQRGFNVLTQEGATTHA